MEFESSLTQAVLLKRHKRFLAEIVVNNQEHRIVYCPNIGAMLGCDILGSRVWFSHSSNPGRKFPDTWELVEVDGGHLVSVNTQNTLPLVQEAIKNGVIKELAAFDKITAQSFLEEHVYDLFLEKTTAVEGQREKCLVNIQSVTLGDEIQRGFFPDAPSEKAILQLKGLIRARSEGIRAILFYCVQHTHIERVFPADHIDPEFGVLLRQAFIAGVEIIAYGIEISMTTLHLHKPLEVCIPARMIGGGSRPAKSPKA